MIFKFYRKLIFTFKYLASFGRILHYRLMFPGLYIDFKSYIGPKTNISCADGSVLRIVNSNILSGTCIVADHNGRIDIIDSFIGYNCIIVARKQITIRKNCQIAEMVVIRDQDHKFGTPGLTIAEQGFESNPVIIGENVWLAAKVTVLKGVTIGNNAVVGASSLVRSSIEPDSLYGGIPARRIK